MGIDVVVIFDMGSGATLGFTNPPQARINHIVQIMEPRMSVRMADDLDHAELAILHHLAYPIEPLIIRLRTHTLGRVGHDRLVAILTENALLTGQTDDTATILAAIERKWAWCPLRYIPWPPRTLRHLFRAAPTRRAGAGRNGQP